ncbi:MAG: AI-2E family transporter [Anaerolineae bacterium]|nr:AI-2E family transporter [Anaerolineae bacterium]
MIDKQASPAGRFLLLLIGIGLLMLILRAMGSLLNPIFIGVTLGLVCLPFVDNLRRRGIPSAIAVLLVIVGLLVVGLLVVGIVGISTGQISESLPTYQARIEEIQTQFAARLAALGIQSNSETIETGVISAETITRFLRVILGSVSIVLAQSLLILGITVFTIIESLLLPNKLKNWKFRDSPWFAHLSRFNQSIRHYLVIKTWISLLTGSIVLIFLWFMRIDFLLLWAFLAFILNYIPSIGSILASIPAIFIALMQYDLRTAVIVGLGYWIINYVVGWGIEPRWMGKGLNLSILTVFLSLIIWAWILGPIGMFLSLPLTVLVKFILEGFDETRPMALLLSDRSLESIEPSPDTVDDVMPEQSGTVVG